MKKTLIVIMVVLVAAGAVFTGYYLRPKPEITAQTGQDSPSAGLPEPAAQNQGGQNPQAGASLASSLGDVQIDNYFVNASGTIIAVTPKGKIVAISNEGTQINELAPELPNYAKSIFSPDGTKIALSINGDRDSFNIFTIATKGWLSVPADYQNLVWSPDSKQIAATTLSAKGESVIIADANLKQRSVQTTLNGLDYQIAWAGPNLIISDRSSGLSSGSILALNTKSKAISVVAEDGYGMETIAAPDGRLLLFKGDVASKRGGTIYLLGKDFKIEKEFGILTLPSKCAFGNEALFCAIPKDQAAFRGEILPDSYYNKSLITSDNFYKIDLNSGDMSDLGGPLNTDATLLKLNGNRLYFKNRLTNRLGFLDIK